jgi:hypothetical protein
MTSTANMANPAKKEQDIRMPDGSASNISFPESGPALQPIHPPPPASAPFFARSAPIDIPGANARQARQLWPVIPDHILRNTPSHPDSDFYLLPRLPTEPIGTTQLLHSLVARAVVATAPIPRPITPEIPEVPIKDLLEKTPPKCQVPFCAIMSVLLTTGKLLQPHPVNFTSPHSLSSIR